MPLNRDVVLMPKAVPPLGAGALGSSEIWWVRSWSDHFGPGSQSN